MVKAGNNTDLDTMRHSLAHIMASAVTSIWPEVKLGVGPPVEDGFYYDIDLGDKTLSEEDFGRIEKAMTQIINEKQPFEQIIKPIDEAIDWAKQSKQPYKEELLNDLKRAGTTVAKDLDKSELGTISTGQAKVKEVSFYRNGNFIDLCRGPQVENTAKVGAFKLMRVAGAYWRGRETNPQMQRLYAVAFATKAELDQYLDRLEEAKKRDHRKLGKELDLFVISDLVGPGLPLFTPRGTVLRDELGRFSQEIQEKYGYQRVMIPHITRAELYKISGHYDKYPEKFTVTSEESDDEFILKPMSCPHHAMIYASRPRSYRDLPIRYMENTQVYRDEKSGELHGLSRVRMITQDDSHCFCTPQQVGDELSNIVEMVREMYTILGMEYKATLSFKDSDDDDKYLGDAKTWQTAQKALEDTVKAQNIEYEIVEGEATFYGPKVDFMVKDALGRQWQCATLQLDFLQPQRFGLEYVDSTGAKSQPVMIHKALLGSIERFLSVYIEHTAGKFPIWLAPEQIRIITVNQEYETYAFAESVVDQAKKFGLRVSLDNDSESVGKKIRKSEQDKVPYTLVIGPKEIKDKVVTPRIRSDMAVIAAHPELGIEEFLKTVAHETKGRVTKSSL
ncbi:threonine--tRNA ligase [Candidatus Saccharibacteria bacterium RIFCSPHIGHO2_12_FULL_41_12]|nr:MAG: threonine--tRNA ligase [Candidatus Saccharibacteria bacterium RIFCSPHIGHO2_12_FULL_41_12]